MFQQGLDRLRAIAKAAQLDTIVLLPGHNLYYLTHIHFHLMERPFLVFIPTEGEPVAVLPALEAQQFGDTGFPGEMIAWDDRQGHHDAFVKATDMLQLDGKKIGVEGLSMRVREYLLLQQHAPNASIVDADSDLIALRISKSPEEIAKHRKAIEISEKALEHLLAELKLGMSEREVADRLVELQQLGGGEGNAFKPIVLFGARSALPHGEPGDTRLKKGDTVLIDFGTRYAGYVSDITRTFFVGEPSPQMRDLYMAVLAANTAGREAATIGISGADLDQITTQVLIDHGFADYIQHRTGHGIGIDVHEHPNISIENTKPLVLGSVFTIEPGLYIAGVGGVRIEDNVALTEDGTVSLSTFLRDLQCLDLS